MTERELAERIVSERNGRARRPGKREEDIPFYMMNISHPALAALYERWRKSAGKMGFPPTDEERTEFELAILSKAAKRVMAERYQAADKLVKGEKEISE